jgi:lipopolysaccharide export system protein LptA
METRAFRSLTSVVIAVVALSVLAPAGRVADAQAVPSAVSNAMDMNGYQVETAVTNANLTSGDFTMPQEVKVTRPGTDARGDKAKGNMKLGTATLIGNVVVHDNGGAPEAKDAGSDYQGPSTITCDELTIDTKTKTYDGHGNMRFVQGTRVGTAQRGVLNQLTHKLHLEGNVVLADGQTTMRANVVDYNLVTRDVIASGGPSGPMIIREPIPQGSPGPPPSPKPSKKKK